MRVPDSSVRTIDPELISPNPRNPRRYFKQATLDELRSSIQKVGMLVPLIVYPDPETPGSFVLLDGERRLQCAIDLGLFEVPANVIPEPSDLDNILRMFNIHSVREEWPLISVAQSLQEVIAQSGIDRDRELAELTGLKPATVRRAKRLLALPPQELELITREAHLPRPEQVHREDLYLEILDAVAAIERVTPRVAKKYGRDHLIRQLAAKREEKTVRSVTDYREVVRLLNGVEEGLVDRAAATKASDQLIREVDLSPVRVFDELGRRAFARKDLAERAQSLAEALRDLSGPRDAGPALRTALKDLLTEVSRLVGGRRK